MEDQPVSSEDEPTVLDWVKSLLKLKPIPIPEPREVEEGAEAPLPQVEIKFDTESSEHEVKPAVPSEAFQFSPKYLRLPFALFLGFLAQFALESKPESLFLPVGLYLLAGLLVGWATWAGDFHFSLPLNREEEPPAVEVRAIYLVAGAILSLFTFLTSRANRFTSLNLVLWIGSMACFLIAFWEGDLPHKRLWNWIQSKWQNRGIDFQIRPWHILVSASIILIVFFRTTQIERVPVEMWSDQAEKLWDVMDVLSGKYSIFFPRNTGREMLQFYMAAAVVKLFNTGISFTTLKITTIFAGLITLPYLYLFAKEFGGRYVGLAAILLAGVGYWPNVISRLGLRFPLYPLFVAPALYYLLRGIRLQQRNDFILCGFAVGLGLHGYSSARVIPFAVVIGVLIYLIYQKSAGKRRKVFTWLILSGVIALVVFMPLLGVLSNKDFLALYLERMISRVGPTEQPLPGSPLKLLVENFWRGLRMFAWDDGEIWVVSIPFRPLLDWVTGALFNLGLVIVFIRFLRTRRWQDLFLLFTIPILILPSVLALAFPGENPAPNRAAGAMIPVFTIAAMPLVLLPKWAREVFRSKNIQRSTIAMAVSIFIIAAGLNFNLVFDEFVNQHLQSTWNATEIGTVMKGFAETIGSYDTAHIIRKAYWVDTRLVRINAGDAGHEYAVWPSELDSIPSETDRPQLFIFKEGDNLAYEKLKERYPNGVLRHGHSAFPDREFMLYYVFPYESIELDLPLTE
jgi:hypothetical protein